MLTCAAVLTDREKGPALDAGEGRNGGGGVSRNGGFHELTVGVTQPGACSGGKELRLVPAPLTHSATEANNTPRTHLCSLCQPIQAPSQDLLRLANNSVRGASALDPTHSF